LKVNIANIYLHIDEVFRYLVKKVNRKAWCKAIGWDLIILVPLIAISILTHSKNGDGGGASETVE
jgi:hypothetical protein